MMRARGEVVVGSGILIENAVDRVKTRVDRGEYL